MRRALLLVAALGLQACVADPPPARLAYLRVIAEPVTTTVYESEHFVGSARLLAKQPKAMRVGTKYLTFKAPGHFPHDVRLKLPAGETTVKIKLRPIPP